ncbi:hypothetical protein LNKW23_20580 [Paralimibaculum aggregatum]|uniref:DUF2383 domain-containing protein n=1 Tax=Paralimibaculum aggregatum TaxID=3036245 RepID=A0ABQ6LHT1_9RHOB|nr:hypothetical protein [Limibaculum sp. NKW23]GMG82845.1 hypothetical protein LNKW23_20580 [Limibaculum sp. NKW23]
MSFTRLIRSVLSVTLVLGALAAAAPANAQSDNPEVIRARVTQLYLHAEDGLRDLFDASGDFERALAAKDRFSMNVAAARMFQGSTAAAFWSVVLDDRVNALGAKPEVLALSGEMREITITVHNRLAGIVATNDMDALAKALDDSADGLTRLRDVVKKIYDIIQANVRGE